MELARRIRERIQREGPLRFSDFMRTALYESGLGYYTRSRDPFGRVGDFYTAAQLQPVFGELVARAIHRLAESANLPRTLLDLGAGRGEMGEVLGREFEYIPVDAGDPLPPPFSGIVFANEFFDALPVDVAVRREGRYRQRRVTFSENRCHWIDAEPLADGIDSLQEQIEIAVDAPQWVQRIAARLIRGYLIVIDYGYTRAEHSRFPHGSLMSYRHHAASPDVLAEPGERDITAHVDFDALRHAAQCVGFGEESFTTLQQWLLNAGEADQFASVLSGEGLAKRRGQLKSLLFGMGETFRVMVLRK